MTPSVSANSSQIQLRCSWSAIKYYSRSCSLKKKSLHNKDKFKTKLTRIFKSQRGPNIYESGYVYFCKDHLRAECKPFGKIWRYFITVRSNSRWICCIFFILCVFKIGNLITVILAMFCTCGEDRTSQTLALKIIDDTRPNKRSVGLFLHPAFRLFAAISFT